MELGVLGKGWRKRFLKRKSSGSPEHRLQVLGGSLESQGAAGAEDEAAVSGGPDGLEKTTRSVFDLVSGAPRKQPNRIEIPPERYIRAYDSARLNDIHFVIDLQNVSA